MTEQQKVFLAKSEIKAHDLEHKRKVAFNIGKYNDAVVKGKQQFANLEIARQRAKNIKWKVIENLDKYLEEFEKNFTARGGKLIWAETAEEALQAVLPDMQREEYNPGSESKINGDGGNTPE